MSLTQHMFAGKLLNSQKFHFLLLDSALILNINDDFSLENQLNAEISFVCNIWQQTKTYIRITFQVHCLEIKKYPAMAKRVIIINELQ